MYFSFRANFMRAFRFQIIMGNKFKLRFHKVLSLLTITNNKISFTRNDTRKSILNSTPILTAFRKAEEPYKMQTYSACKR